MTGPRRFVPAPGQLHPGGHHDAHLPPLPRRLVPRSAVAEFRNRFQFPLKPVPVVDGEKMSRLNIYPPSRRGLEVCRRRDGSAG